ncbi:MAG: alpha/beta hydrolase [Sandaracinaceae bacterium]|nr:alpha/beta hydrolase [Sandaracinaceae bacterium]
MPLILAWAVSTLGGCAPESEIASLEDEDIAGSSAQALSAPELCDTVFSREHLIDVGDGVQLHVLERFTGRSLLRHPRRAMLMIPATLTNNDLYDARVNDDPSYNALETMAREGFFAYSVNYEGYGLSTHPEDGKSVTFERSLEQMARVIRWIRHRRFVSKVDVLGTSVGSDLAIALGGLQNPDNHRHVGHIVLTAVVYRAFTPFVQETVFTPEFEAFLRSIPGGYLQTSPEFYAPVMTAMDPDAQAWLQATAPDVYALGPTLEAFDLPATDGSLGRAPALLFYGTADPVTARDDVYGLQAEYGGTLEIVELEGGAHSSFLEPVRHQFWDETLSFLTADEQFSINACDYLH